MISEIEHKIAICPRCGNRYKIYTMLVGDQSKCHNCRKIRPANHWGTGPKKQQKPREDDFVMETAHDDI